MRDNKGRFVKGHINFAKGRRKYSFICEICRIRKGAFVPGRKYCSRKCYGISRIGNTDGFTNENTKGNNFGFKIGHEPWNYIDGRSKLLSPARYGDDWDKIRYIVYSRDRFTCQDCGIKGIRLDVHHKIPFLISFDNSLNNLTTLCRSCHMKEEANLIRKIKQEGEILCRQQK